MPDDESVHAFFFDERIFDLNSIVAVPAGWKLTDATGINEHGEVSVIAYTGKRYAAVRLTPEPQVKMRPAGTRIG